MSNARVSMFFTTVTSTVNWIVYVNREKLEKPETNISNVFHLIVFEKGVCDQTQYRLSNGGHKSSSSDTPLCRSYCCYS